MSEQSFGLLTDHSRHLGDSEALRQSFKHDGYLYIPGFFKREDVLAVRREIVNGLEREGLLAANSDPMDAVMAPGEKLTFRPDLANDTPGAPLHNLLYGEQMMSFYEMFFGETARHFDFTWLRVMGPGAASRPHCDIVYMGRGTFDLMTAWVPYGDHSWDLGGLMVLEGSHLQGVRLKKYLSIDVDTYCENRPKGREVANGKRVWQYDGNLSNNPVSLRDHLGGRWLSAKFRAGDLLTFGMGTVHASTDNQTERIRISSDSRYQPASHPADHRWVGPEPVGHGMAGKRGRIC